VADVMRESSDVSRSTIYRRLLGLQRKGMVEFKADRVDRRLKFVLPTSLAEDYIARLSACVDDVHIEARS
jgi:DNA-binding MarR family transcriptional regulator